MKWIGLAMVTTAVCTSYAGAEQSAGHKTVRWEELTANAEAQYKGDGLTVSTSEDGAQLRCVFQRLEGRVSDDGLWLVSTEDAGSGRFQIVARSVGREGQPSSCPLDRLGETTIVDGTVRFVRPGLVEEYSVSMDGVRQDFLVLDRPGGAGALRLELEVTGAHAEAAGDGAQLILPSSAREIAYTRLRVTDASGRDLDARMDIVSTTCLAVLVDDTDATYPVRIDPVFTDADWVSMGGPAGTSGDVHAIVADGAGNIYVGGSFQLAGDVLANGIARWNGTAWSALGTGLGGGAYALALSGTDLYVGGVFTTAGGVSANHIAKWNGTTWSALGTGMGGFGNAQVNALAVSGPNLYVGGWFTTAGGIAANYIARWNGSTWSAMGTGMNDAVLALAVSGSNVYAGGRFTTSGGVTGANYIAQWNGSAWSPLSTGLSDWAEALAVSGTDLYVGGRFITAGGVSVQFVAKWNGTAWSAVGSPGNMVMSLAVSGTDLYAGGTFTTLGGINYVAKWNGTTWLAMGTGLNSYGYALAVSGGDIYVGGPFTTAGGTVASHIAKWNGSSWSRLGVPFPGLDRAAESVVVSGTDVYVGGIFNTAGNVVARNIAKWDGSTWSALGSGTNLRVSALAVIGTDLYAGGQFTFAGGISASHIAKWDGTTWSALGSGVGVINETVAALAVSGTDLYVGGVFATAGGVSANNIARWDGSGWSALGSGVNGQVNALKWVDPDLYVGGGFTTAGGVSANRIAMWDGTSWSALGSGMNSLVSSLEVYAGELHAGGYFTTAGSSSANFIAKWNGSAWSALGSGLNSSVTTLAANSLDLYVGGAFTTAGGVGANRVARWNGSAWFPLGSGLNASVSKLAVHDVRLYAVGPFWAAGGTTSMYAVTGKIYEDFPVVVSIADVPNDQGGRVRLRFARSRLDTPLEPSTPVTGYQIYHRIDGTALTSLADPTKPFASLVMKGGESTAGTLPPGLWEAVTWVGATQSESYTALVPTTADSSTSGIEWSVYSVTSHTTTPSIWFASPADSGYSVDNLAPNVPTGFVANYQSGNYQLDWDDPVDADFRYFKIYRSTDPGFMPGPSNLVHSTTATTWTDASPPSGSVYYKLVAVDFAGNESATASASIVVSVDGSPLPVRFALHPIAPNPVQRQAVFAYDVPHEAAVELRLYDVSGRRVRTLVDARRAPGRWSAAWDGRDDVGRPVPDGMYLLCLEATGLVHVRKLVMTR